jgi:hypothetical protein
MSPYADSFISTPATCLTEFVQSDHLRVCDSPVYRLAPFNRWVVSVNSHEVTILSCPSSVFWINSTLQDCKETSI